MKDHNLKFHFGRSKDKRFDPAERYSKKYRNDPFVIENAKRFTNDFLSYVNNIDRSDGNAENFIHNAFLYACAEDFYDDGKYICNKIKIGNNEYDLSKTNLNRIKGYKRMIGVIHAIYKHAYSIIKLSEYADKIKINQNIKESREYREQQNDYINLYEISICFSYIESRSNENNDDII